MIVVDPAGNLFDERRKTERRKTNRRKNDDENAQDDRRSGKDRRTDEWVKELLENEETQEEN